MSRRTIGTSLLLAALPLLLGCRRDVAPVVAPKSETEAQIQQIQSNRMIPKEARDQQVEELKKAAPTP